MKIDGNHIISIHTREGTHVAALVISTVLYPP